MLIQNRVVVYNGANLIHVPYSLAPPFAVKPPFTVPSLGVGGGGERRGERVGGGGGGGEGQPRG